MESKGLLRHSPRSPIYGETLACCTRTVYPLDFSGWRYTGELVCFFGFGYVICTWKAKVCPCIAPRSPVYGETLAHYTCVVYPPRFLRTVAHRWASVFLWLWLGHTYMESKGLPMHSPPKPVYSETLPLDFAGWWHTGGLVCFFGFG
jgi:hypothetical protein